MENCLSSDEDIGASSKTGPLEMETVVRLVEDAVKYIQEKTNCSE